MAFQGEQKNEFSGFVRVVSVYLKKIQYEKASTTFLFFAVRLLG